MYDFGRVSIKHNMVNIPSVNHIPYYFFAVLEAEVDFKATPVIHDIGTLYIIPSVENNFLRQWGI